MNFSHKSAYVSSDQQYRYWLRRGWNQCRETAPYVLWVLLNPSTADAVIDDNTVRKAAGFSDRWGYKAMMFVNLYAYRATNPRELKRTSDPVGPENDRHITQWLQNANMIVAAWGQDPVPALDRPKTVLALLRRHGPVMCLGTNINGHPCHPLMLPYTTEREQLT